MNWDTENDALESQMAEWFPRGLPDAETRTVSGTAETEDLDAACAALIEWVD